MNWKTGRLPLKGLRVVDWSVYWAGPYLSMTLHDLGAEVIKVESPSSWDPMRTVIDVNRGVRGTQKPMGPQERSNISQHFNEWNRGKLGLAVELRESAGRDVLLRLVRESDIFVENHRPHVKEKLRITYDDLREVKPDLIYVSLSGYGQTLPDRDAMALGSPVEVASGLFSLNGYVNDPTPAKTGFSYGDPVGALTALSGLLLALRKKRRTGEGSYLDIALRDSLSFGIGAALTATSMNDRVEAPLGDGGGAGGAAPGGRDWEATSGRATTSLPARPEALAGRAEDDAAKLHRGNRHPVYAPQGVYRALGEDEWVAISIRDDADWAALAEPLGNQTWLADERFATAVGRREHHDELDERIEAWTRERPSCAVEIALQEAGVPAGVVLNYRQLRRDPQLNARGMFREITHPAFGREVRAASLFERGQTAPPIDLPAPMFGQHNHEVLTRIVGFEADEVRALERDGVIGNEILATGD
jgi:crotonobetainyl-CoA:carnitine CoA-transferase CaiB-like acyl-CoA transferase